MTIPGQISIFDFLSAEAPTEEPEKELDDSICENCKWRKWKHRRLEVNENNHLWVYCCPGTACANWKHGTPLNLTCATMEDTDVEYMYETKTEEKPYCFNRDFLPGIDLILKFLTDDFGLKFEKIDDPKLGWIYYRHKFKKSVLEIDESHYRDDKHNRFIGVSWEASREGMARPCDNLEEVYRAVETAIDRSKKIPNRIEVVEDD